MKTALLTLDYILDIVDPTRPAARCGAHAAERGVIDEANRAIALARSRGWPVIHVKLGFSPSYIEMPQGSPFFSRAAALGVFNLEGEGTRFHPQLDVRPEDAVVVKHRVSAFYATALEAILRAHGVERLVIAGVSSTWAVQAAARDAHDRDYRVLVLEPACAAASDEEHQVSMRQLAAIAGVVSQAELESL
ncbi:isochorismatase family cysteine hydrolase [Chromobacterium sp. IIBBL 290-4]|uniref:isochorismatase family cysteine hydrolase n=1 Tax=Chromobacterium sp. IIBBL 290-4 TaxID=2953890 RepID=UPI0020B69306|nr:isochorismatase family cysteine hydrolase [Chromobacterium sp. IIBBL 290-4]UTH76236.1 cysteine hydrolase [Chromobacterium sp. IIBBL 290-4]